MTSNAGVELIKREPPSALPYRKTGIITMATAISCERQGHERGQKDLPTRILNRIDEIIVFHELSKENLNKVVDLMLGDLQKG
jgi:ATP-dependent Clp protease ATP-binding subunit ClpC